MVRADEPDTVWQYRSDEELFVAFNGAISSIHATRRRISRANMRLSDVDALARDIQREVGLCRVITRVLAQRGRDTGWRD